MALRVVAVGDSLSEGVGDPSPLGLLGWVHHLCASSDCTLELAGNFARTGAKIRDVRATQLARAVDLKPDIVTSAVGVNDVLSRSFRPEDFEADYAFVLAELTKVTQRGVLVVTFHDFASGLPVPERLRAKVRERISQANEVMFRLAAQYGCWVLDARAFPLPGPLGMLSVDRLHPNRRGHRYLAASAHEVLRANGALRADAAFPRHEDSWLERRLGDARHLAWLARKLCSSRVA